MTTLSSPELGRILSADPLCEAVVQVSAEGLPIAWHPGNLADLERLTQVALSLYQAGRANGPWAERRDLRLCLEMDFGRLELETCDDGTLLLIFARLPGSRQGDVSCRDSTLSQQGSRRIADTAAMGL